MTGRGKFAASRHSVQTAAKRLYARTRHSVRNARDRVRGHPRGVRAVCLRLQARSIYPECARRHPDDEFGEVPGGDFASLTQPFVDEPDGAYHAKIVGALFIMWIVYIVEGVEFLRGEPHDVSHECVAPGAYGEKAEQPFVGAGVFQKTAYPSFQ